MRRPLIIYDFATASFEFPYIWGNFLFLKCIHWRNGLTAGKTKNPATCKAGAGAQSNDWYRGTTELVQHFRSQGEFNTGARALLDIDMVWLYGSPIPVGRRRVFTCSNDFYTPLLRLRGEGSAPCGLEYLFLTDMQSCTSSVLII